MRAPALFVGTAVALACTTPPPSLRDAAKAEPSPIPAAKEPPSTPAVDDAKAKPPAVAEALAPNRTRGPVRGAFEPVATTVTAGAPLLGRFWIENVGKDPIRFRNGGHSFAQGQLEFTWVVRDAAGEVECDLRARPEPMGGGGGSTMRTLAPGETHENWLLVLEGCDALTRPGRHQLRVVRVLTDDEHNPAGCPTMLVPDTTVEPPDDRGVAEKPECMKWLLAAPAVASEFEIEVKPYDREAVRKEIAAELAAQRGAGHRAMLGRYAIWLELVLGRDPKWQDDVAAMLKQSMKALPKTWPAR